MMLELIGIASIVLAGGISWVLMDLKSILSDRSNNARRIEEQCTEQKRLELETAKLNSERRSAE